MVITGYCVDMTPFKFKDIETKWQKIWDENKSFKAPQPTKEKPPYYILVMFPYPSGALHVGHGRNYIIGDAVARYKMMQGFDEGYSKGNKEALAKMGWHSEFDI